MGRQDFAPQARTLTLLELDTFTMNLRRKSLCRKGAIQSDEAMRWSSTCTFSPDLVFSLCIKLQLVHNHDVSSDSNSIVEAWRQRNLLQSSMRLGTMSTRREFSSGECRNDASKGA